jgi:hypothetical protein
MVAPTKLRATRHRGNRRPAPAPGDESESPAPELPSPGDESTTSTSPTTIKLPLTGPDGDLVTELVEEAEGQITHKVPVEMVEGETYTVVVRVGDQGSADEFAVAIENAGRVRGVTRAGVRRNRDGRSG